MFIKKLFYLISIFTFLFFIPSHNSHAKKSESPEIELVFVLDTTSSMGGLIEAAKEKIWSIATTFSKAKPAPNIKIGLVGFRDRGDNYITQVVPLNENIDEIYTKLMSLQAIGGGDGPESVNQALHEAVTKIEWSPHKDVYKVLFLVGDAPPHMDYQDDVKYHTSVAQAVKKDITVNTILCGSWEEAENIWKKIAKLGKGDFFQVAQTGNAVLYDTPYDKKIAELSSKLDKTKVYYGNKHDLVQAEKKERDSSIIDDIASYASKAKRAVFNSSKSGKKNFIWGKDLVSDWEDKKIKLGAIKKDHLPKKISKMSIPQREKYLKEKSENRKKIQSKINELSIKRQKHIADLVKKQKNEGKDTLDHQIFDSLKTQSKPKGIILEEYQY